MTENQKIAKIFYEMAELLEIKGVAFKPQAYRRAAKALESLVKDISLDFEKIPGIGESISKKIKEFLKTGKIRDFEKLRKETAIQQIITYYFETKGLSLLELKQNAKKRKIVYSRFTKPAKQLLELAGSMEKAKEAMKKVAEWANTRNLDYAIETVFKKWLELDRLKPKEVVKKPFYRGDPMIWSETRKKWYVISPDS
ncbi:MAG: hypothetical protein Q7J30_01785 [Candidatus Azambacteria bacterium]|nr:hypothetical protein [Candidatus Azambacteria bacterium]